MRKGDENISRYEARINLYGTTQRERDLNRLKSDITKNSQSSLSYKNVLVNEAETNLIIDSNTNENIKEIKTLPNQKIYLGDIVAWASNKWMVTSADSDDEIYIDGKMQECNYVLKWQNSEGIIIEQHVVSSASLNTDDVSENKTMTLGSNQLTLYAPFNNNTIKLRRDKRFFIDNNIDNPTAYKIIGINTTKHFKNGHGYIIFTLEEDTVNTTADRPDLMICDYFTPSSTPPNENQNHSYLKITYKGNSVIKIGGNYKTFTASLYDENNNEIQSEIQWSLSNFESDFVTEVLGNSIKIKTDEVTLDNYSVKLVAFDQKISVSSELELAISMF